MKDVNFEYGPNFLPVFLFIGNELVPLWILVTHKTPVCPHDIVKEKQEGEKKVEEPDRSKKETLGGFHITAHYYGITDQVAGQT